MEYFRSRVGTRVSGRFAYLFDHHRDDWERSVADAKKARYVAGHFGAKALKNIRDDAFVFTFLREPRARLRSHFRYFSSAHHPGEKLPTRDYQQFLSTDDRLCLQGRDNVITRQLACAYDYEQASGMPRDEWLEAARETLARFDLIGFQDRMNADFAKLGHAMNLSSAASLSRTNTTQSLVVRAGASAPPDIIDSHDIRRVEDEWIGMDLKLFDWARQQADAR